MVLHGNPSQLMLSVNPPIHRHVCSGISQLCQALSAPQGSQMAPMVVNFLNAVHARKAWNTVIPAEGRLSEIENREI